jgi:hypothetical protein
VKQFPKTILVSREEAGTDDEYLSVRDEWVDLDTHFERTTPVAKYKLVEVGKVIVTRKYSNGKSK